MFLKIDCWIELNGKSGRNEIKKVVPFQGDGMRGEGIKGKEYGQKDKILRNQHDKQIMKD